MIKYLGSKRRLVPVLGEMYARTGASTALDLFTGTTRVAQEFKRRGAHVTALDSATYSEILAQCYIETDPRVVDQGELERTLKHLDGLPGEPGYFTETFCERARFFQPMNGERVDAIRHSIETNFRESWMYPCLLTSLMEAADRVDSTTGVHMAFVKKWAPRSFNKMVLRMPELIPGSGRAVRDDATKAVHNLPHVDVAYLDPPYNQHRYFTNYHIWETLVRWDDPEPYGIAQKRIDSRDDSTKSVFNRKREMPRALKQVVEDVRADIVILSYNNESWVPVEDLVAMMSKHGHVEALAFDSKRYVGAQIGIHNLRGEKVGEVSHTRNLEYIMVAGEEHMVQRVTEGLQPEETDPHSNGCGNPRVRGGHGGDDRHC